MSMRTFDEIQADVNHATSINDADALMNLATELDALPSPRAEAAPSSSRGFYAGLWDYAEQEATVRSAWEVPLNWV